MNISRDWQPDEDAESRLKEGMFEYMGGCGLFGLRDMQTRVAGLHCSVTKKVIFHNAGWYNKKGDEIGWGDLSFGDLLNIKTGLRTGEVFIVLSELNRSDKKDYIDYCTCAVDCDYIYFIKDRFSLFQRMIQTYSIVKYYPSMLDDLKKILGLGD